MAKRFCRHKILASVAGRRSSLLAAAPYAEGGVRPVQEGGSSGSSGPAAMSDDVEESAPVKKLVAPSAPTADDREDVSVASDVAECISTVQQEEKPRFWRLCIDYGNLNERDDELQEMAGAPNFG